MVRSIGGVHGTLTARHAKITLILFALLDSARLSAALAPALICDRIRGLTAAQRRFCAARPDVMVAVGEGALLGLAECRRQFRHRRWNCSDTGAYESGFGQLFTVGSREAAFVYAISSAAVTYAVTRACTRGQLARCGCDRTPHEEPQLRTHYAHRLISPVVQAPPAEPVTFARGAQFVRDSWSSPAPVGGGSAAAAPRHGSRGLTADELLALSTLSAGDPSWKWGGCSAHVKRGMRLARRFLDAREMETDERALMNLHNNRAGRKAVKFTLLTECKCHGVSGSCSLKTCWKRLPPFGHVGDYLVERYRRAKRALPHYGRSRASLDPNRRKPAYLKLHEKHLRPAPAKASASKRRSSSAFVDEPDSYEVPWADVVVQPKPRDLVFLEDSPNYCVRDVERGSAGTAGRVCNRTSTGPDSCRSLCCGRGFETHYRTRTQQCHCKFHWCCFVRCDTCAEKVRESICK
ncbi:wnt oncogene analog 2 isoform X2 [Amblyomma americanum]